MDTIDFFLSQTILVFFCGISRPDAMPTTVCLFISCEQSTNGRDPSNIVIQTNCLNC